ncbi:GvpL/GvpF family gas vesicle protein [Streptomyces phaeofaciens JCM 4814]|uniref:Gas vesicle protein n=1 Tax=Streptomyces phaeofaciens TaxID=68254 RepID=A0A918HJ83_9ACTN|nr:GvpL/GvpF family gas vesicle protein [Streptomyces phaeofaciens]GGT68248.1 gas vesicle protein [Streptomyces phaeofaciens]
MTERGLEPSDADATYVFAVCRNPDPSAVVGLPGVTDEAPVSTLPLETLTAIVQTVRARDFTNEAWQARLCDEQELERYARAHHDVVSAVAACCPTVPLPMATLYQSEERVREALANEADRFHAALNRIAHHAEWGVKVYVPSCQPDDSSRSTTPTGRSRPAPGAGLAYLDRKRGAQERRERRQDEALQAAEAVDAEVRGLATASRRLRLHGPQPSGEQRVQVLNATYLVAEHRADELTLLTQALRERTGTQIELSGPWVPYSFVGEV